MRKNLYTYRFTRDKFEISVDILFNISIFISIVFLFIYFLYNDLFIKLFCNDIMCFISSIRTYLIFIIFIVIYKYKFKISNIVKKNFFIFKYKFIINNLLKMAKIVSVYLFIITFVPFFCILFLLSITC